MNASTMSTASGARIDLLKPDPSQIHLRDIALSLSRQCRFAGHSLGFYSVAEHSILVAEHLPQELKLHGLLHDAAEAFTGDLISPVKRWCVNMPLVEFALMDAIYAALGLGDPPVGSVFEEIRAADLAVGALECSEFGISITPGREMLAAESLVIRCLEWQVANSHWLACYESLRSQATEVAA